MPVTLGFVADLGVKISPHPGKRPAGQQEDLDCRHLAVPDLVNLAPEAVVQKERQEPTEEPSARLRPALYLMTTFPLALACLMAVLTGLDI
jgi:hypothetical protein